jgi:hypothetical protein
MVGTPVAGSASEAAPGADATEGSVDIGVVVGLVDGTGWTMDATAAARASGDGEGACLVEASDFDVILRGGTLDRLAGGVEAVVAGVGDAACVPVAAELLEESFSALRKFSNGWALAVPDGLASWLCASDSVADWQDAAIAGAIISGAFAGI